MHPIGFTPSGKGKKSKHALFVSPAPRPAALFKALKRKGKITPQEAGHLWPQVAKLLKEAS